MSKWKKDVEERLKEVEQQINGYNMWLGRIDGIREMRTILRMLLDYFNLEVVDTPAETKLQQRKKDAEKKSK